MDGYITKPIKQSLLFDAIMTTLGDVLPECSQKKTLVTKHSVKENKRSLQIVLAEDNLINQQVATRVCRAVTL